MVSQSIPKKCYGCNQDCPRDFYKVCLRLKSKPTLNLVYCGEKCLNYWCAISQNKVSNKNKIVVGENE